MSKSKVKFLRAFLGPRRPAAMRESLAVYLKLVRPCGPQQYIKCTKYTKIQKLVTFTKITKITKYELWKLWIQQNKLFNFSMFRVVSKCFQKFESILMFLVCSVQ